MKTNPPIASGASGAPGAPPRWTLLLAGALLAVAAVAAYHNSFPVPFVFDDVPSIPENPTIRQFWPISELLLPSLQGGMTASGRPVLNLSFALNHAISGDAVWSYHALNLLIHVGATLMLFGVVRRTLAGPMLRTRFGGDAALLAFGIAAVWSLHPLQSESVTYTVQRAESLVGLFYLLTLYAFVRAGEVPASRLWPAVCVLACFCGMATKEVMVTAPLMVLLYDRTFAAGGFRNAWRLHRRLYWALGATWLLLGGLVLSMGGNRGGTVGIGVGVSLWSYPLTQFQAVARYLALTVWPHPLVFEYGTAWVQRARDVLPYAAVVVPLVGATVITLLRWPVAGFCGAWFFGILAPTSLAPGTIQMTVEHRMYLPLAALAALLAAALHTWIGRRSIAVLLALAIAGGWLTAERNRDYRSSLALWADTVAKRPENWRAQNNLGKELLLAGRGPEAIARLEEALRLKPDYAKAHNNLGVALVERGQVAEAIGHYETALRLGLDDGEIHHNLGDALIRAGRIAEAEAHYALALQRQPEFAAAQANNLGRARLEAGRVTEAIKLFTEALRLQPEFAEGHNNLGNALLETGRADEAILQYQAALRLRPDDAAARFNLGNALLATNRLEEACASYRAALALRSDLVEAHNNLGSALFRMGRRAEAAAQYREALRLRPDYAEAKANLAKLDAAGR